MKRGHKTGEMAAMPRLVISMILVAGFSCPGWGRENTPPPTAVLSLPGSCPPEGIVAAFEELGLPAQGGTVKDPGIPWSASARSVLDRGDVAAVVGVVPGERGLLGLVLLRDGEAPIELTAGEADCRAAGFMVALYVNRRLSMPEGGERTLPEVRLPGVPEPVEEPVPPEPPRAAGPAFALQALGLVQAGLDADSPGLAGGEVRGALRFSPGLSLDLGLAAAAIAGPTDAEEGLGGWSQLVTARFGYSHRWSVLETGAFLGLGAANYSLHREDATRWENQVLPRGEVGLRFSAFSLPEVLVEVAGIWEPWTITAYSEDLSRQWPLGGFALAVRVGASLSL